MDNTRIIDFLNLDKLKVLLEDLTKLDVIGASLNQLRRSFYMFCK